MSADRAGKAPQTEPKDSCCQDLIPISKLMENYANSLAPYQVDDEVYEETDGDDSSYSTDLESSFTKSLTSSIYNYQYEHGRRYHAFRQGQYVMPNDAQEQERLDLQHHIWRLILDGRLYTAPLPPVEENPNMLMLDLGTGTGIWAMEMADEFPNSTVYGIDLSPIQPDWVPNNCKFYVDDYEDEWTYRDDEKFDYIHGRAMCYGSSNWPRLYGEIKKHLKPGGWVELQEYDAWIYSDDDSMERAPWTREWCEQLDFASKKNGTPNNIAKLHKQWMIDAGFENVQEKVYRTPIGTWPKDPVLKEIGKFEQIHIQMAVESHTLALLSRVLSYSEEEVQVLCAGVKQEFRDPKLRFIACYRFVVGQKPKVATE